MTTILVWVDGHIAYELRNSMGHVHVYTEIDGKTLDQDTHGDGLTVWRIAICEACGHRWLFWIRPTIASHVDETGFPGFCPKCRSPDHLDF